MSATQKGAVLGQTLKGIQVLDLTRNLAGPYCTMALGDLGAEVIKVERPEKGDDTRGWAPPTWNGLSTVFLSANRNKRSIELDLNTEEGLDTVRRLARNRALLKNRATPCAILCPGSWTHPLDRCRS